MKQVKRIILVAAAFVMCGSLPQQAAAECGIASWYGGKFHGRLTANGERYNMHGISAAHKGLRFGTRVRVTDKRTGRSIVVRINDRGPFVKGRIIDLSGGARQALGMGGLAPVCLTVLSRGDNRYVSSGSTRSAKVRRSASRSTGAARTRVARTKPKVRVQRTREAGLRSRTRGL
jgi:rare lipoprotein A